MAVSERGYGNWRRPSTAGVWGLGSLTTGALVLGLIVEVLLVMTRGMVVGAVWVLLGGGLLLLLVQRDVHHKSLLSRIANRVEWWAARTQRRNLYRSGPLGRTPWGTHQLPGLAASLKLFECRDAIGRPYALIQCAATQTFAVAMAVTADGGSLVDADQIDQWVANWGGWLAGLGDEPSLVAASAIVETAPDTGARLRAEVQRSLDPDAPVFARAMLEEAVATYPAGSALCRGWVTLTFSAEGRAKQKRRDWKDMSRDLAARLPNLTSSLAGTGTGGGRLLTAGELCHIVRAAYDPAVGPVLDDLTGADLQHEPVDWTNAGPAAAQTNWENYHHDSGWSMSWTMSVAPQGIVNAHILAGLLRPHPDIARKRVALVYRPISPARAASIVDADMRSSEFNRTATKRATMRQRAEVDKAVASAREEAQGAGLVNFGIVVTATVLDEADLPEAEATVDSLGAVARLRLRPAYGAQDSTFAAALPLGLVLPRHLRIPSEVKDRI